MLATVVQVTTDPAPPALVEYSRNMSLLQYCQVSQRNSEYHTVSNTSYVTSLILFQIQPSYKDAGRVTVK